MATRAAGQSRARDRQAHPCAAHLDQAGDRTYLRDHKDVASCEATPHHLTMAAPECYERLGTLRADEPAGALGRSPRRHLVRHRAGHHRRARLRPCAAYAGGKAKTYPASPSGMTGVQTLVPLMLDHVNAGRLSLARFVDLTSAGPARLFNIACKGRIAAGYDADFTIVDLKRSETITNKWVASRAGWTPYDGVRVRGWPVGTFVRGKRVMWQGEPSRRRRRAAVLSRSSGISSRKLMKARRICSLAASGPRAPPSAGTRRCAARAGEASRRTSPPRPRHRW